jgi:hypothetical protein
VNCLPKVTSYERRGRADGPASDRRNITTAARENQHLPGAGSGGVALCDAAAIRSAAGPFLNAE